jgi:hypothetical protein
MTDPAGRVEDVEVSRSVSQGQNNNNIEITMPTITHQTITMTSLDEDGTLLPNMTIRMYDNQGAELAEENTGADSRANFSVAENTSVSFSIEGDTSSFRKKTNDVYNTPTDVVKANQIDTLNITAARIRQYTKSQTDIPASKLQEFYPIAWNINAIIGNMEVNHFDGPNKSTYEQHFDDVADQVHRPGMFKSVNTEFVQPNAGQIASMNPYPEGRQLYEGIVGYTVTGESGTSTGVGQTTLSNGIPIIWYSQSWLLGGLNWARTDHEIGNMLGFPFVNSTPTFQTSRDPVAGQSVSIADSTGDGDIMDFWFDQGGYHLNSTDNQGRLIDYSIVKKIE